MVKTKNKEMKNKKVRSNEENRKGKEKK